MVGVGYPTRLSTSCSECALTMNHLQNTNLRSSEYTFSSLKSHHNLRLLQVTNIHAETTVKTVTEFEPDLGLSLAAPILRYPLFSIPRLGTVNLHKGKVPDYRGMPPAFWELWNDEKSIGCTVHWVNDKLDYR